MASFLSNVYVHDVVLEEGDDCIAVKSGMDEAGRNFNRSCHNILFERVVCSGDSIAVGSEMSGGVYNVTFRDFQVIRDLLSYAQLNVI